MKAKLLTGALTAAIAFPIAFSMGLAVAGPLRGRANLKEAEHALNKAFEHIVASQRANEWDEGGHAQKAKELIEHAKEEVRLAGEYDNRK